MLLASCSSHDSGFGNKEVQTPLEPLNCIVVLPATTSVDKEESIKYDEANSLEKGAAYATSVMMGELGGHKKVRLLNSNQVSTLVPEIYGGISGTIAALGKKLNCDGVLVTTVRRFKDREGTKYSADSPASVEFKMALFHAPTGKRLWSGDYRETQESFFSNIFSLDKVKKRGIKWVSADQLMEQAIKERLADCPYLK